MTFNAKTTAFLFPGQGSQFVGMGRELAEIPASKAIFEQADQLLGQPFSRLMWTGAAEELNDTINTQPALFIHSLASYRAWEQLRPGAAPAFVAGHSLGELSALTAAGALSFADGLRLVRKRGELMKQAGERHPGGMAAILGLDIPSLDRVCAESSQPGEIVQVANDNCPGQVVISGHKAALERAMLAAKAAGAKRALPLAVSIAAHSPLMDSIQAEWEAAVREAAFGDAKIPVVGNVQAAPIFRAADLRADLMAQMQNRVRWTESVRWLAAQGVNNFVEVGAGSVLSGLVKRIVEGVTASGLDFQTL